MKPQLAVELLRQMKRIRIAEETIANRYSEGEMRCPTHLCVGQETVGAAAGLVLRKEDLAVSTHRSHGHYLGKGGSLKKMIAEIYGKATGCSGGKGGSMHLIDQDAGFMGSTAIVGGTIPVGVGLGLSLRLQESDNISCIFFGDGSTEEGVFYESVNFAALKNLPVLFLCENNLYSVYSHVSSRQPKGRRIHKMVEALGVAACEADGNDPKDAYQAIDKAISEIRRSGGPRFIEFPTYRWREHCGPNYDNDLGYRTEEEFLAWKAKDPILKLTGELVAGKAISDRELESMEAEITAEVDEAFEFARQSSFPATREIFTDLYKN